MRLVADAARFAMLAHRGQKRKYTGDAYILHPAAVAEMVADMNGTPEMVAAAWLHDVVEDCGIEQATIKRIFGDEVNSYVWWLTTQTTLDMGNRAVRKAMDAARLAHAPAAVHTIKLADLIHNTQDIYANDKKFARTYIGEKRQLLPLLTGGNPWLRNVAERMTQDILRALDGEG